MFLNNGLSHSKVKKVLAIASDEWGCGQYRIIQPYTDLGIRSKMFSDIQFELLIPKPNEAVDLNILNNYEAVVFQRVITPQLLKFVSMAKKLGKIVIQETDDDLFNIDPMNPFNRQMKGSSFKQIYLQSLKLCDYIHTTTQEIADVFKVTHKFGSDKVKVFPNAINTNHPMYLRNMTRRKELPQDKIVFGWQGGSSHSSDLTFLQSVSKVLDKYPNSIFAFCSSLDQYERTFGDFAKHYRQQVITIPPETTNFNMYPNIPSMFDIGLAPLKVNKFNSCKSWLKFLEFGAWGVPTIGSAIPDYERFEKVSEGGAIILKENTIQKWEDAISEMIEDEGLRKGIGSKAQHAVLNKLSLREINKQRLAFYQDILKS